MAKYKVLADQGEGEDTRLFKGEIVYSSTKYDYGLSSDDTRYFKRVHTSVSRNEDGDYPLVTCAVEDLERIDG